MTRHLFLGGMADWATDAGADETSISAQAGKRALFIPGAVVTFWSDASGGTQYTDLLDSLNTPLGYVAADANGMLPQIQGPDGVRGMWVDGGGGAGTRRWVTAADIGTDLTTLEGQVATLGLGSLTDVNVGGVTDGEVLTYVAASGKWGPGIGGGGGSGASTLNGLADVSVPSPVDQQFLRYTASTSEWEAATVGLTDLGLDWAIAKGPTFGAVGDGVADDTAAIQAAIDSVNTAGGGVVYLPRGTYKLTGPLTIKDNVTLRGAGREATVITQTSTSAHAIIGSDLESVTIEDLMIDGPGSGTGRGIYLTGTVKPYLIYMIFRNLVVRQFGGTGIQLDDAVVTRFDNVIAKDNGIEGFFFFGGTSITLTSCYALNNTVGNGYRFDTVEYSSLVSCAADGNVNGYKTESCESVAFYTCGAEANSGDGFQINTASLDVACYSCFVDAPGQRSFRVTGNSLNALILGCREGGTLGTATAFLQVDAGSTATFGMCQYQTKNVLTVGTTQQFPPNTPTARDKDLVAETYDGSVHTAGSGTLTSGTLYLAAVYIRQRVQVSNILFGVTTAASGAVASQNKAGLYNSTGTKLAEVDVTTDVGATGLKTEAITPVTLTPGMYWVALLSNATTGFQVSIGNSNATVQTSMPNGALPAARLRFAVSGTTGQTSLPATITPSANTATGAKPFWAALS